MHQETASYHQAFPLVIYEKKLPGFLSDIYKSFEDHSFDNTTGRITGELGGKVLVHHDKRLEPFYRGVSRCLDEYLDQFAFDRSLFEVNIVKSWFTICDPGQSVPVHYHSCSHISFVYYIQTPGDPLVLHTKNPNEWFGNAFSFVTENRFNNGDGYAITPKPEHLVLFPSHIQHHTTPDNREHQRVSLVGDVLLTLKEGVVSKEAGLVSPQYWKQF